MADRTAERLMHASRLLGAMHEHTDGSMEVDELARLIVLERDDAGDQALILGLAELGGVLLGLVAEHMDITVEEVLRRMRAAASRMATT